jgi:DNA (cytosine-5)-methyltransferase 1
MKENASGYLPTPTVQDSKNNGGPSQMRRESPPLNAVVGGPLNPEWVESFLMGWPIGWTDLQPLEMDKYLKWRHWHGEH